MNLYFLLRLLFQLLFFTFSTFQPFSLLLLTSYLQPLTSYARKNVGYCRLPPTFAAVKTAVAIMILLSLLLQSVVQLGIIGYYELNKAYIAKNLCENRDKPKMKCCGKCYLRKQLKKVEDNDHTSKNPSVKIEKNEVVPYIIPATVALKAAPAFSGPASIKNPARQHLHGLLIPASVFHPPSVSC